MEPKSWQVLFAGALAQLTVAGGVVGSSVLAGDQIGAFGGWYFVAFVLVAAGAALVPFVLMRSRRRLKLAAVLSVLVGVGFLAVNEFALLTWVFPLFLFAAGALSWQEEATERTAATDT